MNILILTPNWKLPWVKILPEELRNQGHIVSVRRQPPDHMKYDVAVHMWGVGTTPGDYAKRNIMWIRGYDFFFNVLDKIAWDKLDHVVNINPYMFEIVAKYVKGKHSLVYNYIDHSKFKFRQRGPGKKIGMACHVHHKKNLPLAVQILLALPEDYELHIAGDMQEPDICAYIDEVSQQCRRKVYFYGELAQHDMDMWWEDKNYCLSTSQREGSPNNIIEAMSKGIKPIVHGWPGAAGQFEEVFYTVEQAVEMITGDYDSQHYRDYAVRTFGDECLARSIDIITGGE